MAERHGARDAGWSWPRRAVNAAPAYIPLLLMAVLALGTWWLVKNTPLFDTSRALAPPRHVPDYTMTQFMVQRFGPNGVMRVQIEGDTMRHYPDDETIEVDNPRIRAFGDDGRVTIATAKRAIANRDGSEVQLIDDAHVVREASATEGAIDFRSNFLHCFQYTEQVRTHLPVVITQDGQQLSADAMVYDNLARVLDLTGHVRATFAPQSKPSAATK